MAERMLDMWALLRDDEIYLIRPRKADVEKERKILRLGGCSKHKWRVVSVTVAIHEAAITT